MFFTQSHKIADDTLTIMGRLFFEREQMFRLVKPRLFPLVIGPTGVGKSHLVETVAAGLGLHYFKVTRGDWLPQGVKSGRPTIYQIIDRVLTHERVLLHIDELDKFQLNFADGDWSAGIGSDLWNLLDGKFPFESYIRESNYPEDKQPTAEAFTATVPNALWIVGSGTWQAVFDKTRKGSTVGFQGSKTVGTVDAQTIARSGVIHTELLHRFNADLLFLDYPSPEETRRLLATTGLSGLAKKLGVRVIPEEIDWAQGGIRVLETLATQLAIARYRRSHPAN